MATSVDLDIRAAPEKINSSHRYHGSQPGTLPHGRQQYHARTCATQQQTSRYEYAPDHNSPNHHGPRSSTLPTPEQHRQRQTYALQTKSAHQPQPDTAAPQSTQRPSITASPTILPTTTTTQPGLPLTPKTPKETLPNPRCPAARLHRRQPPSCGLCGF